MPRDILFLKSKLIFFLQKYLSNVSVNSLLPVHWPWTYQYMNVPVTHGAMDTVDRGLNEGDD